MHDVLCIYYSRTGNTKKAMYEIAEALDAELVEIRDNVSRDGWSGWLLSGMDALRKSTRPLAPFETEQPLQNYRLVILGTPVWAGRCSSVIRGFLKRYGKRLQHVGYVVTRSSDGKFEEVYDQMDLYVTEPRRMAVSLRTNSVGYSFWREDFLSRVRDFLGNQN